MTCGMECFGVFISSTETNVPRLHARQPLGQDTSLTSAGVWDRLQVMTL